MPPTPLRRAQERLRYSGRQATNERRVTRNLQPQQRLGIGAGEEPQTTGEQAYRGKVVQG